MSASDLALNTKIKVLKLWFMGSQREIPHKHTPYSVSTLFALRLHNYLKEILVL